MDRIIGWLAGELIRSGKGGKLPRFTRLVDNVLRPEATDVSAGQTRVALQFDYQGKRVRTLRTPAAALNPPLSAEPDDHGSAIKQAIIRWLDSK